MQRQITWGVLASLFTAGIMGAVWLMTRPLTETAEEFLRLTADQRFEEAYGLLVPSEFPMERYLAGMHHPLVSLDRLQAVSWGTRRVEGGTGSLEGTLLDREGNRRLIEFWFQKTDGDWKIRQFEAPYGWRATSSHYRNDEHRYSIVLPGDWNITIQGSETDDVVAQSPDGGVLDGFLESVSVLGEEIPPGMTLAEYCAAYEEVWTEDLDIRSIDVDEIQVNGLPGRRYLIVHRVAGIEGVSVTYLFVKGEHGYMILATALPGTILTYQPLFEAVVRSFKVG